MMTAYEQQMLNTNHYYDQAMILAESEGNEILASYVTGDQLHQKINNPIDEGIDEG